MKANPTPQLLSMLWPLARQISQELARADEGTPGTDVVMREGGQPEVIDSQGQAIPVSRLPAERMAAVNPAPHSRDIGRVRWLDPDNVERWTPVIAGALNGWTCELQPQDGAPKYLFFAFRSPADSNNFRVAVLRPNMDNQFGHRPHMIFTVVGGQRIPVICGPLGRAAADLEEARAHAVKWMIYHYLRAQGRSPRFSR